MYKYRFFFIIFFFISSSFAVTENDSLNKIILDSSMSQIEKIQYLLKISEEHLDRGNKGSVVYSDIAKKIADTINNEFYMAKSLEVTGKGWMNWGNNAKALESFFAAHRLYLKLNKLNHFAEVLRNIGDSYRAVGQYDKALEYLKQADSVFSAIQDSTGLTKTYNRLAAVYYEVSYNNKDYLDNYDKLLNKEIRFFDLYSKNDEIKSNYDYAIKYVNLSKDIALRMNLHDVKINSEIILAALYNISFQKEESKKLFDSILKYTYENDLKSLLPFVLFNLSKHYFNDKEFENALKYALEAYELAEKLDYKVYHYMISDEISNTYEMLGDYKKANEFTKIHYQKRLEYFRNDIEATLVAARAEYELENISKENLFSKRLNKTVIISSTIVILIITIFAFVLIRKNKKEQILNQKLLSKNQLISEQNEKLEILNIEKDKFLSIIAHDLKNPLGTFKNITQMLQESPANFSETERNDLMKSLKESASVVYDLLENLLAWSMTQRGKIIFNPVEINLNYVSFMSINLLSQIAKTKDIEILNSIPAGLIIKADVNMLNTIIRNLMTNSIKFTPRGGKVEIGLSDNPAAGYLTVFVRDSGIGMSSEVLEKLFRIDESVKSTGTEGEKGTGLGLILCKEFVEKHGGKIWVESEIGKGSTFYFNISTK